MRFTSAPSYRIILFAIHASTYDIKGDVLAEDSHHNWKDDLAREPTAEEYLQHGEPLPAIAASVTTTVPNVLHGYELAGREMI
ncbi:hypothetical protein HYALB_00013731 [Hymenoscyphus albidus]|uniref:Uncharacterized protein n=1 Tax=Hymenoscyphus albidus TaxID=595503 RepID=A0A9N9LXM3_9HELO|nr:hypothetical protein HYALB_00013731 [Hymenoscyphus albidus]